MMSLKTRRIKSTDLEALKTLFSRYASFLANKGIHFPLPSSLVDQPFELLSIDKEVIGVSLISQNAKKKIFDNNLSSYYTFLDEGNLGDRPLYLIESFFIDPGVKDTSVKELFWQDVSRKRNGGDFLIELDQKDLEAISFYKDHGFYQVPSLFVPHAKEGKVLLHKPFIPQGLCSLGTW